MASIKDDIDAPIKLLLIGKSGAGKTGALASLVAAGYRLRIIDTDKGVRPLRSLLMDPRYPYAKIIAAQGIDLGEAVRYEPININMKLRSITTRLPGKDQNRTTSETLLAPVDAKAWARVLTLLDNWKDDEVDLGPVTSWTTKDVLVIDSFSTLAKCVYYFSQSLNGRLGARDQGYDYQRDVGEAQSQLTRLLELLYSSTVPCNVIVVSHITWVDESSGVASRPATGSMEGGGVALSSPDGYPSAIGRALSPQMAKYFNDTYVVRATGSGESVRRVICTVPQEGVMAKTSAYMDREYPVSHGLATMFSAINGRELPTSFTEAFASAPRRSAAPAAAPAQPSAQRPPTAA
jgi:hypothetical protein